MIGMRVWLRGGDEGVMVCGLPRYLTIYIPQYTPFALIWAVFFSLLITTSDADTLKLNYKRTKTHAFAAKDLFYLETTIIIFWWQRSKYEKSLLNSALGHPPLFLSLLFHFFVLLFHSFPLPSSCFLCLLPSSSPFFIIFLDVESQLECVETRGTRLYATLSVHEGEGEVSVSLFMQWLANGSDAAAAATDKNDDGDEKLRTIAKRICVWFLLPWFC